MNSINRQHLSLFKVTILIVSLIGASTICQAQDAHTVTNSPPTVSPHSLWQQHQRRPVSATRYRANQSVTPATSSCDYKELLTNLHDRVSLIVTIDEDLRMRLDNVEKKQANILRRTRQAERQGQQQPRPLAAASSVSDSQKLDALATLLTSTRVAISNLEFQLSNNVTRLTQQTGNLQRRLNNFMRRQQQGHGVFQTAPNFYATANAQQQLVTSCAQGFPTTNNILKLQLTAISDPFYVTCDDQLAGGGWTVIMNRFNGDINFQRGWMEYKNGFGNLAGEFFIGLEKLYALTASAVHELLITLEDFDGRRKYARYNLFAIGNEQESYELKLLGSYEGDAGDSFSYHAGSKFSTFDNDNDGCVDCNCAQSHKGAWWYNWCDQSNLMGPYHEKDYDKIEQYRGIYWQDWLGPNYSLKAVKMLIRPLNADSENRR